MDCESNPPKRVDFEAFMKRTAQSTWEGQSALKYYPHNERLRSLTYPTMAQLLSRKSMTVNLKDSSTLAIQTSYGAYEGHTLHRNSGNVILMMEKSKTHTLLKQLLWMMGDNRHGSQDSRFWGFVPEDHIVGKAWFVLFSLNADQNWFTGRKVRWKRFFLPIHWRLAG